jgi:hypothetical protein
VNEEFDIDGDAEMEPQGDAATSQRAPGAPYACIYCGRIIEAIEGHDGFYYQHDDVPHPETMIFGEEEGKPQ